MASTAIVPRIDPFKLTNQCFQRCTLGIADDDSFLMIFLDTCRRAYQRGLWGLHDRSQLSIYDVFLGPEREV